ncbi:MAG TPA: ATP-binding protein [Polyangiales bacterium]|nr:ATP-binding protein [Polyangiales bacterium]
MTEPERPARGLVRRLALWIAFSTTVSLGVFAAVAYFVVILLEQAEPEAERDTPEMILHEAQSEVSKAMLIAGPIGLFLAVAGSAFAVRRALLPLDRVIQTATRITTRELDERLPVPTTHDEVRAVVIALNGLLARLEAGFSALDRFAADASHELRTPLTVLSTELEVMLQRPRTGPEWETSARICLDEARRLTVLVTALLDMARAGSAPSDASIELRTLVERGVGVIAARAETAGVRLIVAIDDDLNRVVRGDGDSLVSAFVNVLGNAVRYTQTRGEVRISSQAEGRDKILVHVDDNGPGIEASEQQRIFEPFVRGVAGRTSAESVGLGLTIARRLCEHNRATLIVDRSPYGGARFSFAFAALPQSRAEAAALLAT